MAQVIINEKYSQKIVTFQLNHLMQYVRSYCHSVILALSACLRAIKLLFPVITPETTTASRPVTMNHYQKCFECMASIHYEWDQTFTLAVPYPFGDHYSISHAHPQHHLEVALLIITHTFDGKMLSKVFVY